MSVVEYEEKTGKKAKDRQTEIWKQQGISVDTKKDATPRAYTD